MGKERLSEGAVSYGLYGALPFHALFLCVRCRAFVLRCVYNGGDICNLIYSYLLYMKLFALLGLSRLRFALFFIPTSAVVAALAVLLRNAFIKLVVGG